MEFSNSDGFIRKIWFRSIRFNPILNFIHVYVTNKNTFLGEKWNRIFLQFSFSNYFQSSAIEPGTNFYTFHNFQIENFTNFTNLMPITLHLLRNKIFHYLKNMQKKIHQIDMRFFNFLKHTKKWHSKQLWYLWSTL